MIIAEFVPRNLQRAMDTARHIATFGQIQFGVSHIQMQILDPAKVVHLDMILTPDTYKADQEMTFGVNLQMFYKLLRSLDSDESVEIETDGSIMKLNQGSKFHTLVNQDINFPVPEIINFEGPKLLVATKLFQKYVRAIGNIAPAFQINYVPHADTLFLESVNSMYRTLFSIETGSSPNAGENEYRKDFMVKFVEMALNPALGEFLELTLGETLVISYPHKDLSVILTIAPYTEA